MSETSLSENLSFGTYNFSEMYDSVKDGEVGKVTCETGEEADSLSSEFGFYKDNTTDYELIYSEVQRENERQRLSKYNEELRKLVSNLNEEPITEKTKPFVKVSPCLGLLKSYGNGFRQLKGDKIKLSSSYTENKVPKKLGQTLSTGDILRLAGEKFMQSSSQNVNNLSMLSHPSFLDISGDEKIVVELVQNLLASAEKIDQHKYWSACQTLRQCEDRSSQTGTPVQRLVYYFYEALREKIDLETGKITLKDSTKEPQLDRDEAKMKLNPTDMALYKQMPYCQISLYTAVQAIIEKVAEAKKIHVIDLDIRNGTQYAVLFQALAVRSEYPIELLKITAVGTKSKKKIEKTGEWLMSFAQSVNLPFCFKTVMVSDMFDLKLDLFEIEGDETIVVYSSFFLSTLLAKQDRLESLMGLLRDINPCIMTLIEIEANHTSPVFVKRFIESLFFFGAYFDCLGDCMDPDDPHRFITESLYYGKAIRNIVAAESDKRTIRNVNISVWRSFFARFGIIEEELSTTSLYQASLLVKNSHCWSSCSFAMDDKCLTVGWKGIPIISISAWKYMKKRIR